LRGEVEIWYKDFDGMAKKFLSPYGDGTIEISRYKFEETFSPPYGDGTAAPSRQGERPFGFRPFTGMVH
jgi:hypothetical protein